MNAPARIPTSAIIGEHAPGVELGPVGATVTGPFDEAAAVDVLTTLARTETWSRWVVGDLFLAIAAAHDGDHGPAYTAVAGCGFAPAWLNRSIAVAARVPVEHRRDSLSWGHHQAVAHTGVPVDFQPRMLGAAVANGWTVRQLEAAVAEYLARDQQQLDGVDGGEATPAPRLGRAVVAAMFEAAELSPSGWVQVHPVSGRVRAVAS